MHSYYTGVYLSLRGTVYANNSFIPIAEIGGTDRFDPNNNEGLQCITDRSPCCGIPPNRAGLWYFPNGTVVPVRGNATTFYRDRGDNGTVNLKRVSTDVMMPTGLFCCVVPDATDAFQRVCAIGESKRNCVVIQ